MSSNFVIPGEAVAVAEEAIPQQGVYIDDKGYIRAQFAGVVLFDKYRKTILVKPVSKREFSLRAGSVAEGKVVSVSEDVALVRIYSANGNKIMGAIGLLHISQISSEFINDIYDYVKPSDIIRARVLNSSPPYLLSIKEPSMGVILAYCSGCGRELYFHSGEYLVCKNCGRREKRKTTPGYVFVLR